VYEHLPENAIYVFGEWAAHKKKTQSHVTAVNVALATHRPLPFFAHMCEQIFFRGCPPFMRVLSGILVFWCPDVQPRLRVICAIWSSKSFRHCPLFLAPKSGQFP